MYKTLKTTCFFLLLSGVYSCGGSDNSGAGLEDTNAPPAPARLRVEKIGDGEIQLRWGAVAAEGDVLYVVYRGEDDEEVAAVDSTFRTDFGDRGLEYESEYTYYVTAVDDFGREGARSNSVSGQPFNNLAPLAPTTLRAIAHNIKIFDQLDIALDWAANEEADLVGYRVYRSTEEDFMVAGAQVRAEVETPRFVDSEVEVGTVYYYRVTAYDRGNKESEGSIGTRDVALPLPELVSPVLGELTPAQTVFVWNSIPEALAYRVIVTTSPSSGEISDMDLTGDTTAVFKGRVLSGNTTAELESGTVYHWKVVASTKEGGVENSVSDVADFKIR